MLQRNPQPFGDFMKNAFLTMFTLMALTSISQAATKSCSLDVTYKNGKPKTIEIEVVRETRTETLYKKLSGSFQIEILVKKMGEGTMTVIDVFDMKAVEKISTVSDILTIEKDAYKARISCVDELF